VAAWCALHGIAVLRVHDVDATARVLKMIAKLTNWPTSPGRPAGCGRCGSGRSGRRLAAKARSARARNSEVLNAEG